MMNRLQSIFRPVIGILWAFLIQLNWLNVKKHDETHARITDENGTKFMSTGCRNGNRDNRRIQLKFILAMENPRILTLFFSFMRVFSFYPWFYSIFY